MLNSCISNTHPPTPPMTSVPPDNKILDVTQHILTNVIKQVHHCPTNIWYHTSELPSYITTAVMVETNTSWLSASVVAICRCIEGPYNVTIWEVKIPSTHFRRTTWPAQAIRLVRPWLDHFWALLMHAHFKMIVGRDFAILDDGSLYSLLTCYISCL